MKIKTILIQTSFFLLFLSLLEGGSFIYLTTTRQHKIYNVLKTNPHTIWRVKPFLNQFFFGGKTKTNEVGFRVSNKVSKTPPDCKVTVGIFGASPSFGWGVDYQETYTALLERDLKSKGFCFRNFSQIGFSSTQGSILLKEVLDKNEVNLAIVTYLVNDLDFVRFFRHSNRTDWQEIHRSVNQPMNPFGWLPSTIKLAKHMKSRDGDVETLYKKTVHRVSRTELRQNHLKIISLAKEKNIKILNVQLPIGSEFFLKAKKLGIIEKSQKFALKALSDASSYRKIVQETWSESGKDTLEIPLPKNISEVESIFLSKEGDFIHFSKQGHAMIYERLKHYLTKKL